MKGRDKKVVKAERAVSRRQTLRWIGGVAAVAPLSSMFGCEESTASDTDGSGGSSSNVAGSGGTSGAGGTGSAGKGGASSAGKGGTGGSGGAGGTGGQSSAAQGGSGGSYTYEADGSVAWAMGGTAAMKALASYPDPFEDVSGSSCDVTCQMTLGPCHDDQAPEREDISEGKGGLPMRFALRILDDTCKPVTDADVDIWHCDAEGVYSSETADQPDFCTGDNAAALAARFFRGHRMTDNNGVVWFNTCFPGWYSGRAIHVHFTVRRSNRSGDEYLTSQVAFPTSLITEICTKHSEYSARGEPNTPNTSDTVFPSASVDSYTVSAEKMSDGALLAWKTVIIRSSLSSSVCSAGGSSGPGMGGAPPSRP